MPVDVSINATTLVSDRRQAYEYLTLLPSNYSGVSGSHELRSPGIFASHVDTMKCTFLSSELRAQMENSVTLVAAA